MPVSSSLPEPASAPMATGAQLPAGRAPPGRSRRRGGILTRLTIRTRLILLSSALLAVLIATNIYLTRKLSDNSAGMIEAANLLRTIEQANNAQIAFGEVRYWMTDLAVSLLTLSETNAKAARARMEGYLDQLARRKPHRIAEVRGELAAYDELAAEAVEEYTGDRRVIAFLLSAVAPVSGGNTAGVRRLRRLARRGASTAPTRTGSASR